MHKKQTIQTEPNLVAWLTRIMQSIIIFIVLTTTSMADQWKSQGHLGTANDCSNSIVIVACLLVDNASYNVSMGDIITVKASNGANVTAQWQGITVSYQGRIGTRFDEYPLCGSGKCEIAVIAGQISSDCTSTGCFTGTLPYPNDGCQYMGNNCSQLTGTYAWWASAFGSNSNDFSGFSSIVRKVNSIQGNTSQPLWILVVNGPTGNYILPGGGTAYGYRQNEPIPVALAAAIEASRDGKISGVGASAGVELVIVAPPVEIPDVYCNFTTDGDIDLGIVDSSNANNRYSQTYLYSQCTDDAIVTAKIQKSGGGNNLLQMGGLNLRVIFDNSSDTKTYSANTNRDSQIIWGQVTSVGTLTPGEYSQSMIVYLNYE
ncbi:hypothetical protein AB7Z98_02335 [Providencia manganoxydans]|uniref:hypothetical protein n=1 Tax=Providencia manganoxydans TaxID=2923283 RepID=UPI0034E3A052